MNLPTDDWIVVVEAQAPPEAERQFLAWQRREPEWYSRLREIDVVRDIIRSTQGRTLHRDRVRVG